MTDKQQSPAGRAGFTPGEWGALVEELADDLESELNARYGIDHPDGIHPATQRRYDRDMEVVHRARAALRKAVGG